MNTDARPEKLSQLIAQLNAEGVNDYRRYEEVRKFLNFKAREKGIPISGTFELTPLCNLDCKMCYVHLHKAQMQGAQLLPVEQWKQLMQQAIHGGVPVVKTQTRCKALCISKGKQDITLAHQNVDQKLNDQVMKNLLTQYPQVLHTLLEDEGKYEQAIHL